jgi:hypothetical protein
VFLKAMAITASYYHNPPPPISTRLDCAVCRKPVYSRGDVHPQCAVRQADLIDQATLKLAKAAGTGGVSVLRGR